MTVSKTEHQLKFVSNGGAAKCTCGKWSVVFSGQTTGQLSKEWEKHKREGQKCTN